MKKLNAQEVNELLEAIDKLFFITTGHKFTVLFDSLRTATSAGADNAQILKTMNDNIINTVAVYMQDMCEKTVQEVQKYKDNPAMAAEFILKQNNMTGGK